MKRCYGTVLFIQKGDTMAKQIEGVADRILAAAKKEFLDKGYVDASLRTIAAAADTSTNSIYVRFGDKEGLVFRHCRAGAQRNDDPVRPHSGALPPDDTRRAGQTDAGVCRRRYIGARRLYVRASGRVPAPS